MAKKYWTVVDIIEIFEVEEQFLIDLEKEEIICHSGTGRKEGKLYSPDEVEKLRLAKILVDEMDVNLPGVEIILRMRQNIIDMRKQFDAILEDLAEKFKKKEL
jgi:MerR family transcriptional regulator/heat shock protein HspR